MKREENNIKIPLIDLRIGDSIRIKNKLLFQSYLRDFQSEKEEYIVIHVDIVYNLIKPNKVIVLMINEHGRIEQLRAKTDNCVELASWHFRPAVPVFAKDLEQEDHIAPWADERGSKIVSIFNRCAHATRDIVYENNFSDAHVHTLHEHQTSYYQISALYNDIIYTPTKMLPVHISENLPYCSQSTSDAIQQYAANISLLLKSFYFCSDLAPCSFKLGNICKNNATHSNGKKRLCIECLKKIALISIYGGNSIISVYNSAVAA